MCKRTHKAIRFRTSECHKMPLILQSSAFAFFETAVGIYTETEVKDS